MTPPGHFSVLLFVYSLIIPSRKILFFISIYGLYLTKILFFISIYGFYLTKAMFKLHNSLQKIFIFLFDSTVFLYLPVSSYIFFIFVNYISFPYMFTWFILLTKIIMCNILLILLFLVVIYII